MSNDSIDICVKYQFMFEENLVNSFTQNLLALFPLSYAIPSIVLGIISVAFLSSKQGRTNYKGHFYFFFVIGIIVDIISWLINYYFIRLAQTPLADVLYKWLPKSGFGPTFIYFLATFFGVAMQLKCLILSSNRMTAIVFPLYYEKIWAKATKPILILYAALPLFFSWNYFIWNDVIYCHIPFPNTINGYTNQFVVEKSHWIPLSVSIMLVSFTVSISTLIIHLFVIAKLIIRRKKTLNVAYRTNINADGLKTVEIKLFILALVVFINQLIQVILFAFLTALNIESIQRFFANSSIRNIVFEMLPFVADLICLLPPWTLIFLNKKLRKELFGSFLKFRSTQTNMVIELKPNQC